MKFTASFIALVSVAFAGLAPGVAQNVLDKPKGEPEERAGSQPFEVIVDYPPVYTYQVFWVPYGECFSFSVKGNAVDLHIPTFYGCMDYFVGLGCLGAPTRFTGNDPSFSVSGASSVKPCD
ncbi:hypothetical protein C8R47DRAFT_1219017 [Mycena vitilis]|nr:hypothetical protein C8R47DRAFT_1219017 [Mycena vitilis]